MIIPINLFNQGSSVGGALPPQFAQFGTDEVVLLELQGSLDVAGSKEGQHVGKLSIDNTTKKSTLLIGHHLLEGKLVNLPKPLAILHRPTTQEDQDDTMREDADGPGDQSSKGSKEWNIVTIVKRKMVFSRRPMPMVGHVTAPTSSSGRKS